VLLLATLMSKKVEVRLPAVAARQKLDRHAQLENLRGAKLLPGKIPLGFVRISSAKSKPNIAESQIFTPNEIQRQMAVSGKDSEAHGGSPAAAPNLPFTAGDMCAQLNVLSRPIYQCDSLAAAAGSGTKGKSDLALSAPSKRFPSHVVSSAQEAGQPSPQLASSALALLGSLSQSSAATAAVAGSGRTTAYLRQLFPYECEMPSTDGVLCDKAGGKLQQAATATFSTGVLTTDGDGARSHSPLLPADLECDCEVLEVYIDESDGTTGSSNSTGLAARDLLRLSSLTHECTKSNDSVHSAH
jgi:hypothetical protein